jgi:hypothetical protein
VLAVLSCFAGCVPIPIGSEPPAELADNQTLDSLIGEDKSTILTSLGRPDVALIGEKSNYFIYGGYGDEYQLVFMFWLPFMWQTDSGGKLFCVLLEFDEEDIFRRYRIERHSVAWSGVLSRKEKTYIVNLRFFLKKNWKRFAGVIHGMRGPG